MGRLAAWLRPEDVEPALRLLALMEAHGQNLRRAFPISSRSNRGSIVGSVFGPYATGGWIIQQLREAFPFDSAPRYLIFDNDKKYGTDVLAVIEHMDIRRKQITPYSPWQNGAAERWVATVRRDLLDHVIVLNEGHLHRLLSEFVAYYHDDRTHLGLRKGTPSMRAATSKPNGDAAIVGNPRLGGLHHRYEWRQAA